MEEAKQTGKKPGRKKNAPKEGVKKNLLEIDGQTIELTERVVSMARVAKVVKGGRRTVQIVLTLEIRILHGVYLRLVVALKQFKHVST